MKIVTISQTRRQSVMEACTNIVVGYTINMLANIVLFPLFGGLSPWNKTYCWACSILGSKGVVSPT